MHVPRGKVQRDHQAVVQAVYSLDLCLLQKTGEFMGGDQPVRRAIRFMQKAFEFADDPGDGGRSDESSLESQRLAARSAA